MRDPAVAIPSSAGQRGRPLPRLRDAPSLWAGSLLVALLIATAVAGPSMTPIDPDVQHRTLMPADGSALPPDATFLLGTDVMGRDYLGRIVHSARATLLVGIGAGVVATLIALAVGTVAGYGPRRRLRLPGGRVVEISIGGPLMRTADLALAFPVLLLAIALTAVLGRSLGLVTIVLAAVLWSSPARVIHARARVVSASEYVTAAHVLGVRDRDIIARHVLPAVLPLAIVYGAMTVALAILLEATLSFLGAGAPTDTPTWGTLIASHSGYYFTDPRLPLLPATAVFVAVYGFTLLSDGLRDRLDPRRTRVRP